MGILITDIKDEIITIDVDFDSDLTYSQIKQIAMGFSIKIEIKSGQKALVTGKAKTLLSFLFCYDYAETLAEARELYPEIFE